MCLLNDILMIRPHIYLTYFLLFMKQNMTFRGPKLASDILTRPNFNPKIVFERDDFTLDQCGIQQNSYNFVALGF